jgi:hypothetical protein
MSIQVVGALPRVSMPERASFGRELPGNVSHRVARRCVDR